MKKLSRRRTTVNGFDGGANPHRNNKKGNSQSSEKIISHKIEGKFVG